MLPRWCSDKRTNSAEALHIFCAKRICIFSDKKKTNRKLSHTMVRWGGRRGGREEGGGGHFYATLWLSEQFSTKMAMLGPLTNVRIVLDSVGKYQQLSLEQAILVQLQCILDSVQSEPAHSALRRKPKGVESILTMYWEKQEIVYHRPTWLPRLPFIITSPSSSSSSFVFLSLGFTIFGEFLHMWPFFNPTIEVVIFCLHGWCTLGVRLLPAFTHLGHECQNLLSPCDGMHVCTDKTSADTSYLRVLENGVRTYVNSTGSEEGQTCDAASRRTASPTH